MRYQFANMINAQGVDRENGVIRGVSVITEGPALGHGMHVDATTIAQMHAAALSYKGGLKVVDRHVTGQDSIFSTVGMLKNFRIDGPRLRADLHPLKSETGTEKLYEMAETMPDNFGLSVAFSGPHEVIDGKNCARCAEIYNAALVADPAANPSGMFSTKFDKTDKAKAMLTEEEFSAFKKASDDKVSALSAEISSLKESMATFTEASKSNKDFAALQNSVTELSATVAKHSAAVADKAEFAKSIAQEFAKHAGTSPIARQAPTELAQAAAPAENDPKVFIEAAQKHFAVCKNKVQATQLAIKEAPKAYAAFRGANLNLDFKA